MRINHNITAMNSYRNFSANTSKLSKNLEKVSTGLKINRAGDDAAGLAISEKMRAQISGIEGATKNAKDGISLIQTAEGALTEVHDMLNRMTTLAEQSANGTYDDDVDRNQLQKEVEALKTEIDRIADSTNYNGIKLLDGSLSGGSNIGGNITLSMTEPTKTSASIASFTDSTASVTRGDELTYSIKWTENGVEKQETLKFTVQYDEAAKTFNMVAEDGTKYAITGASAQAGATVSQDYSIDIQEADIGKAVKAEFQKNAALNNAFSVDNDAASESFTLESKEFGSAGAVIKNIDAHLTYGGEVVNKDVNKGDVASLGGSNINEITAGLDKLQIVNFDNVRVLNGTNANYTGRTLKEVVDANTFEIDGKKFALFAGKQDNDLYKLKEAAGSDVTFIQLGGNNSAATNSVFATSTGVADAQTIAAELTRVTGREFAAQPDKNDSNKYKVVVKDPKNTLSSSGGKSLDLQIGDTADTFNTLSVNVEDMHAKSIGIGDVDISDQKGAAAALDQIKSAVNYVSNTRGTLGALQNRLDHTINNLGVMKENITSAESLIRDTDVAEEMMTYTKNNILNQSAQAMLAQANQLPQGVLQLLG